MNYALWVRLSVVSLFAVAAAVVSSAQVPDAVGLWEFENSGDLGHATVGNDLAPTGAGFAATTGPGGADTGAVTVAVGSYYSMAHGIAPNDGGTRVNEWTLLVDFQVPALGIWHAFFQTDATPTATDAEYFVNPSGNIGVGDLGYSSIAISTATWYRMVFVFDGDNGTGLAEYHTYLDGGEIATATGALPLDSRFSIGTALLLFSDNNSEDGIIDVSNIAIWDQALSPTNAIAVGAPGATIPFTLPLVPVTASHIGVAYVGDIFTIATASGGLNYQWYKDGAPMSDSGSISGTNTDTLTIDPLAPADSGAYYATFNDGNPRTTVTTTINVFAPGSLPVSGIVGLSLTGAVLALGGAIGLRRRKK